MDIKRGSEEAKRKINTKKEEKERGQKKCQ
jgi:hypothetical protein